ncbi:speckle-type POZ protein-like [Nasonia vitripennis]|uniref:BTB domain-containing protein n=1 Tax=Nasonia vitripennis TaxID=7425 RepID=A0A7M7GBT1_NASVI|nr:speckle-type POZ protein-like [Nasonia vitripennis]
MAYMMDAEIEKATEQGAEDQGDDDVSRLVDQCTALRINEVEISDVISLHCILEGKSVNAHKRMLAQCSPVFATLFNAEMNKSIVAITDVRYEVLVEMIRFIYARKVRYDDALLVELATAAHTYGVNGLKIMCEERLIKILNVDNVIGCAQLADRLRMVKLKKKSIEFIVKNARDVGTKPECELLPREVLIEVLRSLVNQE